ncbi:hypothetical protein DRO41_00085 [Candidatus Bathyarchaeota archaeon]|nr:MAG: hypothetical protein DRO41_00085 [Candidatus Bathyarchaeota archaeon]
MESNLIAQNQNWRVRQCLQPGGEEYAITKRSGRYTLYLHGTEEKLAFYNKLRSLLESYKEGEEDLWMICFGSPHLTPEFCVALTIEDVRFLLDAIPTTETIYPTRRTQ